jgi:hypothetical protein
MARSITFLLITLLIISPVIASKNLGDLYYGETNTYGDTIENASEYCNNAGWSGTWYEQGGEWLYLLPVIPNWLFFYRSTPTFEFSYGEGLYDFSQTKYIDIIPYCWDEGNSTYVIPFDWFENPYAFINVYNYTRGSNYTPLIADFTSGDTSKTAPAYFILDDASTGGTIILNHWKVIDNSTGEILLNVQSETSSTAEITILYTGSFDVYHLVYDDTMRMAYVYKPNYFTVTTTNVIVTPTPYITPIQENYTSTCSNTLFSTGSTNLWENGSYMTYIFNNESGILYYSKNMPLTAYWNFPDTGNLYTQWSDENTGQIIYLQVNYIKNCQNLNVTPTVLPTINITTIPIPTQIQLNTTINITQIIPNISFVPDTLPAIPLIVNDSYIYQTIIQDSPLTKQVIDIERTLILSVHYPISIVIFLVTLPLQLFNSVSGFLLGQINLTLISYAEFMVLPIYIVKSVIQNIPEKFQIVLTYYLAWDIFFLSIHNVSGE